ncbi:hypothetical protein [Aquimarina algiphila]|uniref:hypothetical protein n=1 Tax=Aquimarina algiphila TaxID=2047982 RepID=UPI00232D7969|nr:hypothetical protein [Aquimarina algiphila]
MKKILLIVLMFFSVLCFSQEDWDNDLKTFYYTAVKDYIDFHKSHIDINELYFTYDPDVSIKLLPDNVEGYNVQYVDVDNIKNKKPFRKKHGVSAGHILPIELKGKQINVYILELSLGYKKGRIDRARSGQTTTTFEYSCMTNKWEFEKKEYTGI